jgi:hypothetical protein
MNDNIDNDNSTGGEDVFNHQTTSIVHTILLMRIYDVLMCIARGINPSEAMDVYEAHHIGKILGPAPSFNMSHEADEPTAE